MAGLIPLFLTSNAASGTTRSRPASPATSLRESTNGAETPTTQSPSRTSSPQPQSQPRLRQTAMKRPSFQTPAPLPVLPYTPAEWKKTVAEVKRQHLMRRYRACSERCSEILDNLKDTVSFALGVQPSTPTPPPGGENTFSTRLPFIPQARIPDRRMAVVRWPSNGLKGPWDVVAGPLRGDCRETSIGAVLWE